MAVSAEPFRGTPVKERVLVISPGVLPLPPVLGGAVENLIARLHPSAAASFDMEYVSVRPPSTRRPYAASQFYGAPIHYIDSIDPLTDFSIDNQFELHESEHWAEYRDFCAQVATERHPKIVHIHNEAYLLPQIRQVAPDAKLLLHVNDEVVSRMRVAELGQLASSCDMILACSEHVAREIGKTFSAARVTPPSMEIFYNFVDLGEYDPEALPPNEIESLSDALGVGGAPVVMFVGRLIEQKGPHLLLRAFRYASAACPEAQLVFVGAPWYSRENESPFVNLLREEAGKVADRVRFTGYVDQAEMPRYYQLADIVAVPSIWDDPSPFVAYEAQAMGKPVIASARGGIPEIIADRITGRCIDVFNIPLFAQVLSEWLMDPLEAGIIGRNGRRRVTERFNLDGARRQLTDVYGRLLATE
jgi:glycosyltransferase involved in cell wall biosynthesis